MMHSVLQKLQDARSRPIDRRPTRELEAGANEVVRRVRRELASERKPIG